MNNRFATVLMVVAALVAPALALAGTELREVSGAVTNPAAFDGARSRPSTEPVRAAASGDKRTAEEIAADEQVKADARSRINPLAPSATPIAELSAAEPAEQSAPQDGNGTLYGLAGLGAGALLGGLLALGLSRLTA